MSSARWKAWPQWTSESRFRTPSFSFVSGYSEPEARTDDNPISVYKPRQFFDLYCDLLSGTDSGNIFEIGYLLAECRSSSRT